MGITPACKRLGWYSAHLFWLSSSPFPPPMDTTRYFCNILDEFLFFFEKLKLQQLKPRFGQLVNVKELKGIRIFKTPCVYNNYY